MPNVDHTHRELRFKVVYYGPGLGGKTTNLEYLHSHTKAKMRGKLLALNDASERTLFFDLLPMEFGKYRGYNVRVHLCTVPGQIAQDRVRQMVLRHVDGVVMVVDSQYSRLQENVAAIRNLEENMRLLGEDPTVLPLVVQYNKRDLPGAAGVATLRQVLGIPEGVPEVEAVASKGIGVFDTLKLILKGCLSLVPDPATAPEGRLPSIVRAKKPSLFPGPGAEQKGVGLLRTPLLPPKPRGE